MKRWRLLPCLFALILFACQSETPLGPANPGPGGPGFGGPNEGEPPLPGQPGEQAPAGAKSEAPAPGEPSEFAGVMVPTGVDWFGAIDLRALEGTVLERQFRPWFRYLDGLPDYKTVMEATGAGDLLGHTLIVGGTFAPHTKMGFDLVAAVFGLEDGARMSAWIAARIAEDAPPPVREFKVGHKDGGPAWIAGPSLTAGVEALLGGEGESVNDDEAWVELQRAIDTKAPLWALVRIPALVRAQFPLLHGEFPGLQFFPGVVEILGTTHAAMSLNLGDRLEIRVALKLGSAEDAQVVVQQLEMAAEATLWDPSLFFDAFQTHADGSLVTLSAATSKKAWRISVFWLSIAAQAAAYEEMRPNRWGGGATKVEKVEAAEAVKMPVEMPVEMPVVVPTGEPAP